MNDWWMESMHVSQASGNIESDAKLAHGVELSLKIQTTNLPKPFSRLQYKKKKKKKSSAHLRLMEQAEEGSLMAKLSDNEVMWCLNAGSNVHHEVRMMQASALIPKSFTLSMSYHIK
jgi:hypothetical protein